MNPDIWDNAETGEPSSSSLPHVRAITTTAPTTLPPIPSFHDSPPGRHLSSATNPNPDPNPDPTSTTSTATATTTTTAQLEADALRAYYARASSPSGHASFSTWISAANTAERTANDAFDDRDDAGGGGGGEGQDLLDDGDDDFDDTNFVYENGRRYHANAEGRVLYPLPNDESEQERDDMKHKLAMWVMHEKLFYAPVEEALVVGGMVIDLGTGTGEWAMEMAQKYGKSQIYGCDISPIQPDYVWDNVFFSAADFEQEWSEYPENAFDLIHMRYAAFSIRDPEALIRRAMRHLKPGGYLEFQEITYWPQADDATLGPSTPYAFRDFCYYQQQGLARLGLDLHTTSRLPQLMRAAGMADVVESRHKLPIGRWPRDRRQREKGIWFLRMVIMEGLGAICKRAFCQGLGWTQVQVEMFLVEVRRSLNDAGVHAYFPFTVVYGRKPLDGADVGGVNDGGVGGPA